MWNPWRRSPINFISAIPFRTFFRISSAPVPGSVTTITNLASSFIGLETDKTGILEWGFVNNVPYHLTRTCYRAQEKSCGKCGSCVERLEAFEAHDRKDPIPYE